MTFAKSDFEENPKVYIVILNWNNYQDTKECIESLEHVTYLNKEILIIDNGSTDGSDCKLKEKFPQHKIILNKKNLGFSAGCNVGIKYALEKNSDYVLLLNNDTIVDKNFLSELVKGISSDTKIGLIGGKIYYFDNRNKIWSAGGGIKRFTKKTYHFGDGKFDNKKFNVKRQVDFLSGCCLLVKRDVFETIGLLDPDYFMYYEDVDFCLRAKGKAYRIVYLPESVLWHKAGNSSSKSFIDYYRMKNYFLLLKKRFGCSHIKIMLVGLPILLERLARIFLRKLICNDSEKISKRVLFLLNGFIKGLSWKVK